MDEQQKQELAQYLNEYKWGGLGLEKLISTIDFMFKIEVMPNIDSEWEPVVIKCGLEKYIPGRRLWRSDLSGLQMGDVLYAICDKEGGYYVYVGVFQSLDIASDSVIMKLYGGAHQFAGYTGDWQLYLAAEKK